jgi:hypothetical protein
MTLDRATIDALPTVEAELSYLVPMTERPRNYAYEPPAGVPWSNTSHEPRRLPIHDARPIAADVSLDGEGFGIVRQRSAVRDFQDDDEIRRVYYPESIELLKQATGADRVFIFDHTVRRHIPGVADRREAVRQPARFVHVDHTAKSGPQRVRDLIPEDAETLLHGRVQVINLWRPIIGPVQDAPLAVAAAPSIAPQDLVPQDLVYENRVGETYGVTYSPTHRWFYFSEMRTDEGLLLKCFDSKTDGRARFAPHTSFKNPNAPIDAPPRQSIEIRSLVFHRAA